MIRHLLARLLSRPQLPLADPVPPRGAAVYWDTDRGCPAEHMVFVDDDGVARNLATGQPVTRRQLTYPWGSDD